MEIYTAIYTKENLVGAPEILQYIFTIKDVASTFVWDNVYCYHIEFHELMELNPTRNWNKNYQHGWPLLLKEKIERNSFQSHHSSNK